MITHSYSFLSEKTRKELEKTEKLLETEMSKGKSFISKESLRLLKGGGKRIRPLMTVMFSMLGKEYNSKSSVYAAATLETIHMATLVHDDTIDNSTNRRGVETTFKKHGIHTAVYTGDWMFVKALQFLSKASSDSHVNVKLLEMLSEAMEAVCQGEIDQYYSRGTIPDTSQYFLRIKAKTASLFHAACIFGAQNSSLSDLSVKKAGDFGNNFGIAFQIQDDILDLNSSVKESGKQVNNDLKEGIITLPVLLACKKSKSYKEKVQSFLNNPDSDLLADIREETISLGGIESASEEARKYLKKCEKYLDSLHEPPVLPDIRALLANTFSYL